jgi:hypothetical protein
MKIHDIMKFLNSLKLKMLFNKLINNCRLTKSINIDLSLQRDHKYQINLNG